MKHILFLSNADKGDLSQIGKEAVELSGMLSAKFPIPAGFVIPLSAFQLFLRENNLNLKIDHLMSSVNFDKHESMMQVASHIRKLIRESPMPHDLTEDIFKAYQVLSGTLKDAQVEVRSSLISEDMQYETSSINDEVAYVSGDASLLLKIKDLWSGQFEGKITKQNYKSEYMGMAIIVQVSNAADQSGTLLTIDPVTNDKSKIIIEAILGDTDGSKKTSMLSDHFEIDKSSLQTLSTSTFPQTVLFKKKGAQFKEVLASKKNGEEKKLGYEKIHALAALGKSLEQHFANPLYVEWSIVKKSFYIRRVHRLFPSVYQASSGPTELDTSKLASIASGTPSSVGIVTGPLKILTGVKDVQKIRSGDILVTKYTDKDYIPAIKKAAGVITEEGGRMSHAALFTRELGIPSIVGVKNASKILRPGTVVTINGATGSIYRKLSHVIETKKEKEKKKDTTVTKIFVGLSGEGKLPSNLSNGVGLLNGNDLLKSIGIHPKSYLQNGKEQVFIDKLSEKIAAVCQSVSPLPVTYKVSDLTTQELRELTGGKEYEPIEYNPLLGFRGALRYVQDPEMLKLELEAVKVVRNKKNLKNLSILIPFVRTVDELIEVKRLISSSGLYRSESFKIKMMVDIPANIFSLDKFIHVGIDEVSVDLTRLYLLLLGTDRKNTDIMHSPLQVDESMLWALEHIVKTANKNHVSSVVHADPSLLTHELLEKLILWGLTGVTLSSGAEVIKKSISHLEMKRIS